MTWIAPDGTALSEEGNPLPILPRFYTALARAARRQRDQHVRIAWLGDSHTQPDIWTEAVRHPLQERFGNGGPGFVHVGWKKWAYMHTGVDLQVHGKWSIQPPRLLSVEPWEDGVLGLGGVRLIPRDGASARVDVRPGALPGAARWELSFRLVDDNAALRVVPSQGEPIELGRKAGQPAEVSHVAWETPGPGGGFAVRDATGRVELFGVTVETTGRAGVVLDTLGLNGARAIHALGWDAAAWQAALRRREPALLVLAYGTNEAGIQNLDMDRHRQRIEALLKRAKDGRPELDCLVIGAMDRGGPEMTAKIERINDAQRAAAAAQGCAFWSAQTAMGGKGAMATWAQDDPPLAAKDHVHLSIPGYRRLGAALARDLLRAFDAGRTTGGDTQPEPTRTKE